MTREERLANLAKAREVRSAKIEAEKRLDEGLASGEFIDDSDTLSDPTEALDLAEHKWLGKPGNSLYIPSWYKPHKNNHWVTKDGKSLGFKIGQVMAHRRWAIRNNGELMDQRDFEPLYEKYIDALASKDVDVKSQFIPRIERFVDAKPDPSGGPGFVAINFDPNAKGAVNDDGMRYDPIKDVIFSIKEDMARSARLEKIESLSRMLIAKEISGEAFEREMREIAPDVVILDKEAAAPA